MSIRLSVLFVVNLAVGSAGCHSLSKKKAAEAISADYAKNAATVCSAHLNLEVPEIKDGRYFKGNPNVSRKCMDGLAAQGLLDWERCVYQKVGDCWDAVTVRKGKVMKGELRFNCGTMSLDSVDYIVVDGNKAKVKVTRSFDVSSSELIEACKNDAEDVVYPEVGTYQRDILFVRDTDGDWHLRD